MKKIFSTRLRVILAASAVLAALIIIFSTVFSSTSVFSNAVGVILSPFRSAASAIANRFEDLYGYMYEFDGIKAENQLLKEQIAQMEQEVRDAESASEENTRLRELLNLREKRSDLQFEAATVVSWDTSNWGSCFTVSKGTRSGVEVGMCVITETGAVIGTVTEAGLNWATVTTILDDSVEIGAMVFRSGDIGVAQGKFDLMKDGLFRLSYLPADAQLRNGDTVLTTGAGEMFPGDLVLGYIKDVGMEDSGTTKYAIVEPAVSFSDLVQVFIVTSYEIDG